MNIEEIQREIEKLQQIELQNQSRLNRLQWELQQLRGAAAPQNQPVPPAYAQNMVQNQPVPPVYAQNPVQNQPVPPAYAQNPVQNQPVPPVYAQNPVRQPVYAPAKPRTDMENVIGKAWMGILASVLIFASLIFFATVLIPQLTDAAKMAIMYVVSIGFLAAGLMLMKRKNSAASVAVSACGLGSVYLSMLMSDIYFQVIEDVVLYLFLLVWAIGVAYLSRTKSSVFLIIGQIGLVLSVLLGVISCAGEADNQKLLVLTIFFLLSAAVYEVFNPQQRVLNLSFSTAGFAIMTICAKSVAKTPYLIMGVLLCVAVLRIVTCAVNKLNSFAVFDIIYVAAVMLLLFGMLSPLKPKIFVFSLVFYVVALLNIAAAHLLYRKEMSDDGMIVVSFFNAIVMAVSFIDRGQPCLYILLVPLVLMVMGFASTSIAYKIESYAALALLNVFAIGDIGLSDSLFEAALLVGALVVALKVSEGEWMKVASFLFLHLSIYKVVYFGETCLCSVAGVDFSWEVQIIVTLALWLTLNLVFKFVLNRENGRPLLICTYAASALLMLLAANALYGIDNTAVDYYLMLLVAAAVFANNVYRFIRSVDVKYQLYGGLKVTAFLVIVLTSLQAAPVLLSAALLVLSILWILAGFALSAKAVRIYGLVITNISIVKLILIDITYNSTLEKAAGFFICGILCFVISFIYSRIDRNRVS